MYSNSRRNWSITHSLAHQHQLTPPQIGEYDIPILPKRQSLPYKVPKTINPLTQRSRKHRILEERNTEIEKSNRMLFQKIRKIKLKNMYHSQRKLDPQSQDDSLHVNEGVQRNLMLPLISLNRKSIKTSTTISNKVLSMNSTKSHLNNILQDRSTFVQKYFFDLQQKKAKKIAQTQLGVFVTQNDWKVRVILVQDQNLLLIGKKGRNQLTKKYLYSKVKQKIDTNLKQWVQYKFSFEP